MSLTSFTADKNTDSCLEVIALGQSPLIAIRIESIMIYQQVGKLKM